jgi:hypothetical protein
MDRKEFLKSACGLGVCACTMGLLGLPEPLQAGEPPAEDQRLAFVRYQLAKMVGFMATDRPPRRLTRTATPRSGEASLP